MKKSNVYGNGNVSKADQILIFLAQENHISFIITLSVKANDRNCRYANDRASKIDDLESP